MGSDKKPNATKAKTESCTCDTEDYDQEKNSTKTQNESSFGAGKSKSENWSDRLSKPKRKFSSISFQGFRNRWPDNRRKIDYIRLDELARPRWITAMYVGGGQDIFNAIKPSVLKYEITPRLLALTAPRKEFQPLDYGAGSYDRPYPVPSRYADVESHGIGVLSRPRKKRERYIKVAEIAPSTGPKPEAAVQFKLSERIMKLSKPIMRDIDERTNPFAVSKAASSRKPLPPKQIEYYSNLSKPNKQTSK